MRRPLHTVLVAIAMAALCSGVVIPPTPASARMVDNSIAPNATVRQVDIDGRFVTLRMFVIRAIGGAPNPQGNTPTTTVHVTMSIQDGAPLPNGLRVAGVRFEKLRGVQRLFFTPVTDIATQVDDFELDLKAYQGDLSERSQVQRLKATIRLKLGSRVIRVPMGTLPVQSIALP